MSDENLMDLVTKQDMPMKPMMTEKEMKKTHANQHMMSNQFKKGSKKATSKKKK